MIQGVVFEQLGHSVAAVQMSIATLQSFFKIDPEVQRELDPRRREEIRDFIISSLEKDVPFYFSSFIFSARGKVHVEGNTLHIEPGNYLYAIDGQHRVTALLSAINQLQSEADFAEEFNKKMKLKSYGTMYKYY